MSKSFLPVGSVLKSKALWLALGMSLVLLIRPDGRELGSRLISIGLVLLGVFVGRALYIGNRWRVAAGGEGYLMQRAIVRPDRRFAPGCCESSFSA